MNNSFFFIFVFLISSIAIGVTSSSILPANISFITVECLSFLSGLILLYRCISDPKFKFNLFFSASALILIVYPIGIINTYYNVEALSTNWVSYLNSHNITFNDVIQSQAITNMFCVSLLFFGLIFHKGKCSNETLYNKSIITLNQYRIHILLAIIALIFLQLFLILSGEVTFQGVVVKKNLTGTYPLYSFVKGFSAFIPFCLSYYFWRFSNIRALILILIELIWSFLFGRSDLLFFSILLLLGYFHGQRIILSAKNVLFLCVGLFILFKGATTFQNLKFIGAISLSQDQLNLENIKSISNAYFKSDSNTLQKLTDRNLAYRTSTPIIAIAKFHNIFNKTNLPHLQGLDLRNNFLMAFPSSYFVDKKKVLVQEALYKKYFPGHFYDDDIGETIWLQSYIDFGYWGVILIHPLILYAFIWVLLLQLHKFKWDAVGLIVYLVFYGYALTMVESTFKGFFVLWRDLFFLILIMIILRFLFPKFPKTKPSSWKLIQF